jgi:YHS domain-containing protein
MDSLFYFVIWGGLIFLLMRFGCGAHVMGHGPGGHGKQDEHGTPENKNLRWTAPETDVDPVCGTTVHTDSAKSAVYDGTVYYFCSRECRERFEAAPALYLAPGADQPARMEGHSHG